VRGSALATFVYILPFNSSLYGTAPLIVAPLASCTKKDNFEMQLLLNANKHFSIKIDNNK
jgi:hypothetical protein